MVLTQNEHRQRYAVGTHPRFGGSKRAVFTFKKDGPDPLLAEAKRMVTEGYTGVAVTEELTTWRGKNGQRTTVELSREPMVAFDGEIVTKLDEATLPDGTLSLLRYESGHHEGQFRVCNWFDGDEDEPDEAGDRFWIANFEGDEAILDEYEGTEARTNADEECDDPLSRAKAVFDEVQNCPETYVDRWIENHHEDVPARFFR